jgi:hypothetical protein
VKEGAPLIPAPRDDEDAQHQHGASQDRKGKAERINVFYPDPDDRRNHEDDIATDCINSAPFRALILIMNPQVGESDTRDDDINHRQPGTLLEEIVDQIRYLEEDGRGELPSIVVVGEREQEVQYDADDADSCHHDRHSQIALL